MVLLGLRLACEIPENAKTFPDSRHRPTESKCSFSVPQRFGYIPRFEEPPPRPGSHPTTKFV